MIKILILGYSLWCKPYSFVRYWRSYSREILFHLPPFSNHDCIHGLQPFPFKIRMRGLKLECVVATFPFKIIYKILSKFDLFLLGITFSSFSSLKVHWKKFKHSTYMSFRSIYLFFKKKISLTISCVFFFMTLILLV